MEHDPPPEESEKSIDVLLVDDEPEMLEMLSELLTARGVSNYAANNGQQAVEAFRGFSPKLIVSDYNMPGLNGMELFRLFRDLGNRAPVIWLTGHSNPEIVREAWLRGVLNIFEKPVDVKIIIDHCIDYLKMTPKQLIELRPRFLTDKMFKTVSLDIDAKLYDRLTKKCIESSSSMSRFISALVEKKLKEK